MSEQRQPGRAETDSRAPSVGEADRRLLLRIREAAELLALSERQVWSLITAGELRPIRPIGIRLIRVAREDVVALVDRWREQSQGAAFGDAARDDVG
jgi:excisionase family DNA binding protein